METATVAKDTWTELHEAEAEFNRKKVVRAGVEAVLQNAALPAEIDALGEETAAYKNRRAKRRRERETDHERRTKCMRTHENGKHFNIAETTRAETVLAGALGMHLVDHPVRAAGGVYVVRDPAEPPETIRLVAILTGDPASPRLAEPRPALLSLADAPEMAAAALVWDYAEPILD